MFFETFDTNKMVQKQQYQYGQIANIVWEKACEYMVILAYRGYYLAGDINS